MLLKKQQATTQSGEPRKGDERLISLTEKAAKKSRELMSMDEVGDFLRVAVNGGGCNGLSYKLKFVSGGTAEDILVESSGINVLVDTRSALYLRGTIIDYSDDLMSGGFKFSNPNSKSSCGCGESFSV